jgi:FdhD protein
MAVNEPSLPEPIRAVSVQRSGRTRSQIDHIATETPVALVFNGVSHAVMMATPADLEAFALGFALSEGLLHSRAECRGIEVLTHESSIEVQLEVAAGAAARMQAQRRSLVGRTGCGLCGIDSLQRLDLVPERITAPPWIQDLKTETLSRAFEQLPRWQPFNAQTGAHHAAAWATCDGEITTAMEDVGRHNALDKLLGQRALSQVANDDGFIIMSSRASYELVRKCARMNVPLLATISAPTALAVDIARQAGLQLFGFCRGNQAVRYTQCADDAPTALCPGKVGLVDGCPAAQEDGPS